MENQMNNIKSSMNIDQLKTYVSALLYHCVASSPDIGTLAVRRIYIVFKNCTAYTLKRKKYLLPVQSKLFPVQ